jgi:flavin reductase (DIM6/NTAB) family NADH-FMN oxidoreductase RutF
MECRLIETLDFSSHNVFIGEIVATYCDDQCLEHNELVDFSKIQPLLFTMSNPGYWALGEHVATPWKVGMMEEQAS